MGKDAGDDQYSDREAQERLRAALKGARIAGHKPMESLTQSEHKKQRASEKKTTKKKTDR